MISASAQEYLSFNVLISRLQQRGYEPMSELRVMTPLQMQCETQGLTTKQAVQRVDELLVIRQLPAGCVVKRGINVLPEDMVSSNDKIISFRCSNNQVYAVPIEQLVNNWDQFDPDA